VVAIVRRESKDRIACAMATVPQDTFDVGPVGLQGVHRELLDPVLAELHQQTRGAKRPVIVIPSSWVRAHLLDFDHLPRRRDEMEDVVRWRLKKLLPVPPQQLRLALVTRVLTGGARRLLCMVALERSLADLEEAFLAFGVAPGCITSRVFALSLGQGVGPRVVIQQEPGFLSTILTTDNEPALLRTKPLPELQGPWEVISREQSLIHAYMREQLEIEGPMSVSVLADAPEVDHGLRAWWTEREGIQLEPQTQLPSCTEPAVAEQLGACRLEPVCVALGGLS
jgi:hypothetical protein